MRLKAELVESQKTYQSPPVESTVNKLRRRLFNSPLDTVIITSGFLIAYLIANAIDWIFLSSIWSAEDEPLCREATGACWSVIDARHRIIIFVYSARRDLCAQNLGKNILGIIGGHFNSPIDVLPTVLRRTPARVKRGTQFPAAPLNSGR